MRENKFRGKRKDNGEWAYGGYYRYSDGRVAILTHEDIGCQYWTGKMQVDPSTVGQYIGEKDKHGREIYEGDILACGDGRVPTLVFWDTENNCWSARNLPRQEEHKLNKHFKRFIGEVIGNIHENPELLDVDMSNEIEHEYTDIIVCPWCGHSDPDSWGTEPGLWECDNCKKSYYVERNEEVTYSTQKANYGTCKHCGKENVPVEDYLYGDIGSYKNLCPDCGDKEWRRLLNEYSKGLDEKGADPK